MGLSQRNENLMVLRLVTAEAQKSKNTSQEVNKLEVYGAVKTTSIVRIKSYFACVKANAKRKSCDCIDYISHPICQFSY